MSSDFTLRFTDRESVRRRAKKVRAMGIASVAAAEDCDRSPIISYFGNSRRVLSLSRTLGDRASGVGSTHPLPSTSGPILMICNFLIGNRTPRLWDPSTRWVDKYGHRRDSELRVMYGLCAAVAQLAPDNDSGRGHTLIRSGGSPFSHLTYSARRRQNPRCFVVVCQVLARSWPRVGRCGAGPRVEMFPTYQHAPSATANVARVYPPLTPFNRPCRACAFRRRRANCDGVFSRPRHRNSRAHIGT